MTKDILIIPEGYDVDRTGKVFCLGYHQEVKNRWGSLTNRYIKPREMKPFKSRSGYLYVDLRDKNRFAVHRLVASKFLERSPDQNQVNHKNGLKTDNRVENLEWCNQSDNMSHAAELGLRGGFYGKQKLIPSKDTDAKIMDEYNKRGSIKEMDGFMGCCRTTIGRYIRKRCLIENYKVSQYG